jgi:hypothetical protein
MKLEYMFGNTHRDGSPRLYRTDNDGVVAIQGYRADAQTRGSAEPPCPDHEDILVFTPGELEILERAVAMLKGAAT